MPRVAVVGLGYWGPNLVRVFVERTDVEVRWIPDGVAAAICQVVYDPARYAELK